MVIRDSFIQPYPVFYFCKGCISKLRCGLAKEEEHPQEHGITFWDMRFINEKAVPNHSRTAAFI